jgi:hypothetical protein
MTTTYAERAPFSPSDQHGVWQTSMRHKAFSSAPSPWIRAMPVLTPMLSLLALYPLRASQSAVPVIDERRVHGFASGAMTKRCHTSMLVNGSTATEGLV